jgi:hypothetical protein
MVRFVAFFSVAGICLSQLAISSGLVNVFSGRPPNSGRRGVRMR